MNRLTLLSLALTACSPWIRPRPPAPQPRDADHQLDASVKVESYCDPFDDGTLGHTAVGSGVMVSGWQVLTAIHVVDCRSSVPIIHVTNRNGERWKFLPEKEWVTSYIKGRDGVARLQMASGSTLSPELPPPTVNPYPMNYDEVLYLEAASPTFTEHTEEATGWEFGGEEYGGKVLTYKGWSEEGNSGGPVYDINGDLTALHLGTWDPVQNIKYGAIVTSEMIPH